MINYRSFKRLILISLALLGLSITSAYASLIAYDESVSGDISNGTFTLDTAGNNTWTGSSSWENLIFDHDTFFMTVDSAVQVTGFSVLFSNISVSPSVTAGHISAYLRDFSSPFLNILQQERVDLITGTASTPIGPPAYPLIFPALRVNLGSGVSHLDSFALSFDYSISVLTSAVSPVPIPAGVWLFGSALIGLVGIQKRKKTAVG